MCVLVTIWPQRTSMLLSAFCSWCFRISGMHRRQNFMLLSSQFLPSTFLFPVISYFCFPPAPPFFLFLGIYYASLWKEKFSWKPGELWNNFTIHNLLFERGKRWGGVEQDSYWNFLFNHACFFFGILLHLFNWIVLICVYMSMERWLIHKLGGKVVYDH